MQSTRPRPEGEGSPISSFSALLATVRDAGLLRRRRGFYAILAAILTLALGGCVTGFVLLGDSWFQLLIAGALGIVLTQFAFLAHEASHRQVFQSGRANDVAGRILASGVVGISYAWWMTKHTRHHANPNAVGRDPDVDLDTISFLERDAKTARGIRALITRRQGYLFFPLLAFEGLNLHVRSMATLFGRGRVEGRGLEISIVLTRLIAYLAVVFLVLPLGMAFAFVGVQLVVFGVYMGGSFAPNHTGMPIIEPGRRLDFLRKQVLTSRNISGAGMIWAMGGLNYQIEHHLFPSMPRPHLARAAEIVREHCARLDIPYTQTSLLQAYGVVTRYLNQVGLAARDPFDCPMVNRFRRA